MADRSAKMKQAWQDGKFDKRKKGFKWNRWTPPMDAFLYRHEGKFSPTRMAEAITEEFGVPRTANGVIHRLYNLGLSPYPRDYTLQQVARYFGIDAYTAHTWLMQGYLQGEKLTPGQKGGVWMISPESVEELIRNHPEMYHPDKMPKSQWQSLADMIWRKDPLFTLKEVATLLHTSPSTLGDYIRKGWIDAVARVDKNGRTVRWYIKRSQLSRFFVRAYSSSFPTPSSRNGTCVPDSSVAIVAVAACS